MLLAILVDTLADEVDANGVTSLREAIAEAASNPGDDTITIAPELSGAIALSLGELSLDDSSGAVTIEASSGASTIDAEGLGRVLRVAAGTTAVLDGWTIQGGASPDFGGGVDNAGTLTLNNSTVSGNSAGLLGGGVYNSGTLTLTGSTVEDNSVAYYGGGVYNRGVLNATGSTIAGNSASSNGGGVENRGEATLTDSTVSDNVANHAGGGVENWGTMTLIGSIVSGNASGSLDGGGIRNLGSIALTDSTVSDNVTGRYGGGISNVGSATFSRTTISGNAAGQYGGGVDNRDSLTMTDSTVSGNSAETGGGGFWNSATLSINNSTISGNAAVSYSFYGFGGGGGFENNGTLTITGSTIAGNTAGRFGGGGIRNSEGSATLTNTIVARNSSLSSNVDDIGGLHADRVTGSHNLIGDGGSSGLQDGVDDNIVGVAEPLLGPLGDYGGPTWTIPLLPGSRAIDAGAEDGLSNTDQRGLGRVGAPDIGAFESQGFILTIVPGGSPQSAVVGTDFANPLAVVVSAVNPAEPVAGGVVSFVAIPSPGGASATLAASATIGDDGAASVVATANATVGSYTVVASTSGAAVPAVFATTNVPASATSVSIAWGTVDSAPLETAADGLRLLPEGRKATIPWSGIHSITITFDGEATLTASDVAVTGVTVADYGPVTISQSGTSYTITLARPITSADRVTITIAAPSINPFVRRLDVLPGDVNDNHTVDPIDLMFIRRALIGNPSPDVSPIFLDVDGNGVVDVNDYNLARRNARPPGHGRPCDFRGPTDPRGRAPSPLAASSRGGKD